MEIFSRAFCLRNGFHCNGDQTDKGYSDFRYRPFTLEGNFAAAAGLQEMLLQSYSGTIRVFPAVPASWRDASFKGLRAEGAFLVSAERKDGTVQSIEIVAEVGTAQSWGDATVKTLINRLLKKKALRSERTDGRHCYHALVERADYVQAESQGLLDRLFDGQLAPMVAHFASNRALRKDEIARLKKLISELDDDDR